MSFHSLAGFTRHAAVVAAVLSSVLAIAPRAVAHPGGHGHDERATGASRLWTNQRTGEAIRGCLLATREGSISIERDNGDVVVLAMNDLAPADREEASHRAAAVYAVNALAVADNKAAPERPAAAAVFELFAPHVRTRWDGQWLFVESDGLPHSPAAHAMMVGIRSWQQQVPLPQPYAGANAWRIPLKPQIADKPISARTSLYRGAIALAANGIPIFNALNNRGDDALKAGELDEFGGHCGRADDYHYHIAPLVLQKVVGPDRPIAYALDGFPLYGLFNPAAKPGADDACPLGGTERLDEFNGHFAAAAPGDSKGLYHYHASKEYPYINGGMRGVVAVKDDQIDPQPRARPVRDWLQPLRGANITGFKQTGDAAWSLEYTLSGSKRFVNYRISDDKYIFDFVDANGKTETKTYAARGGSDRPQRANDDRPRRPNDPPPRDDRPAPAKPKNADPNAFSVSSPAVKDDGVLPAEFTCDGASLSLPIVWDHAPEGTKSFAITMHHIPGPPKRDPGTKPAEDKHVYLVIYNLPADCTELAKADKASGDRGVNTVNGRPEYAPPCSKGPGFKTYTITAYALSVSPELRPEKDRGKVTMDTLLAAIKDKTLATATLDVQYARPAGK